MGAYQQTYQRSLDDPEGFWAEVAEAIHWDKKWDKVLDESGAPEYHHLHFVIMIRFPHGIS